MTQLSVRLTPLSFTQWVCFFIKGFRSLFSALLFSYGVRIFRIQSIKTVKLKLWNYSAHRLYVTILSCTNIKLGSSYENLQQRKLPAIYRTIWQILLSIIMILNVLLWKWCINIESIKYRMEIISLFRLKLRTRCYKKPNSHFLGGEEQTMTASDKR